MDGEYIVNVLIVRVPPSASIPLSRLRVYGPEFP
jgi:hypothetical protein